MIQRISLLSMSLCFNANISYFLGSCLTLKLCLKWIDIHDQIIFFKNDKDFADVTLACEREDKQINAQQVVPSS